MKNMYILYSMFFAVLVSLFSCEKIFIEDDPADTPRNNFEAMWKTLDEKYSFFRYKYIDWDFVYSRYSEKIRSDMTDEHLFMVLSDMLYELKDGHVNLMGPFDFSRNWSWYLDYPTNFDYDIVERYYLKDDYEITGPLYNTIIDSVGYIYYASFGRNIGNYHIDYVLQKFKNCKGLVFDIRNNQGGFLGNSDLLVSRFADKERLVAIRLYKAGSGHEDFTQPIGVNIGPQGDYQFTKPIVVLTNRQCYSAANDFVAKIRNFPHVTILGDKTGGGGGLPVYHELPNGWRYRFSTTRTYTPEWENVENGIEPDTLLNLSEEDLNNNIDTYIKEALKIVNK